MSGQGDLRSQIERLKARAVDGGGMEWREIRPSFLMLAQVALALLDRVDVLERAVQQPRTMTRFIAPDGVFRSEQEWLDWRATHSEDISDA